MAIAINKTADQLFTLDPDKNEFKELISAEERKRNRIGEYKKAVLTFETDLSVNGLNIYFSPALCLDSSPLVYANTGVPVNAYTAFIDDTTPGAEFDMGIQVQLPYAADLIKNDSAKIVIIDDTHFQLVFLFYQIYDTFGYLSPTNEENRYKLLKDRLSNPVVLNLSSASSIYTQQKNFPHVYLYLNNPVDSTVFGSCVTKILNYQAGFYSKNDQGLDPYFTQPEWELKNQAGETVTELLSSEKTKIKFRINSPTTPTDVIVWMIKTSSNDNTVDMRTNYDASFYKLITSNTDLQKSNKIWTPSATFYPVGGDQYECFFSVKNTALKNGETYRFIGIAYFVDNDYSIYEVNSFISDEYSVKLSSFTGDGYSFNANISDYLNKYEGNDLRCVIKERLKSSVSIDYSAGVFSDDILNRLGLVVSNDIKRYLKSVTVEMYEDNGDGIIHYFDRITSQKIDPASYSTAPGFVINFDDDILTASYDFRVRYESWIQNLETTIDGVYLLTPSSNQNWSNRNIKIRWKFELYYDDYFAPFTDVVQFAQAIRPHENDAEISIVNNDNTNISADEYYLNDANPCFKAKLLGVDGDYKLITTVEREPGSVSIIEENDEFEGLLSQLDSDKFSNQEIDFSQTEADRAKFCLVAAKFFVNSPYTISVIAKRTSKQFEDDIIFEFEDGELYEFE